MEGWLLPSERSTQWYLVVGTALVLLVSVGFIGVATYQQLTFERTVNTEVEQTLNDPEYANEHPVTIRIEYSGIGPLTSPETITVVVSRVANGSEPPRIAGELERRIRAATGRDVAVRVRFVEYQTPDTVESDAVGLDLRRSMARPGDAGAREPPSSPYGVASKRTPISASVPA